MSLATIPQALTELRAGRSVIVADNESRENEGDVIMAAELVTAEQMAFIVRCGGLVCVALEGDRLDDLSLPLMVPPDDPARLGAALRAWLLDAELRGRLRRAAVLARSWGGPISTWPGWSPA